MTATRRPSRRPQLLDDQAPLADQQRQRRAAVDGDLEGLAILGADVVEVPAESPGNDAQMGGAGDRQELRRSLNGPENGGAPNSQPGSAHSPDRAGARTAGASSSGPPGRRRRQYLIRK